MSLVAPTQTFPRRYAQMARHFAATRALEVCALQASPLLGAYLGSGGHHERQLGRMALMLLGSLALTAHVFLANDWADHERDSRDLRRASARVDGSGIQRDQLGRMAIALLLVANVLLASLGVWPVLFGDAIAALSVLYSCSPRLGKSTPVAASLNHLVGGGLHFLLGYSVTHTVGVTAIAVSVFFGLVFAAGHLNQEVRDYEADRANGVGTVAVSFGPRQAFLASVCLFTLAYALIVGLAAVGVLSKLVLVSAIAWLAQVRWSREALRRRLGPETALWMQRRYRLLFALVGLAMVVRW
jgi:4-hydroxybenzoate polyprenyltransferase